MTITFSPNDVDYIDKLNQLASTTGGVSSVSATSPVQSTGGSTPVISIPAATNSVNGYLTSADWVTFNGKLSSIPSTAVTAGSYGSATQTGTFTVGADGRLTLAGNVTITPAWTSVTGKPTFATVATSGSYGDLSGTPTLATVATTGNYSDLSGTPSPYSLPKASTTVLGGVKVDGTTITADVNGVISSVGGGGGGGSVVIKDEGTTLTAAVTSIDFVGAGVTATNTGSAVTVTIPATDISTKLDANNPNYTGTLTGGTGIINIGSNQFYKDAGGSVGIGGIPSAGTTMSLGKSITGAATCIVLNNAGAVQTGVTGVVGVNTQIQTAPSVTLSTITAFRAAQGSIGVGSTITNQYGFQASFDFTGATNNYGFYGNLFNGAGRWNFYANGDAPNYMAGNLLLGSTTDTGEILQVNGNAKVTGTLSLAGKTITLGGNFTTSGAFTTTLTATGNTNVTMPTSGTLLSSASAVTVAQGGTGATSLTFKGVLIGNGTSPITSVSPSTAGNVLTSNGTDWVSSAPSGGGSGTVTSVSVTTANGVSGSVATATTTPAITITLGDITPSKITMSGSLDSRGNSGVASNVSLGNAALGKNTSGTANTSIGSSSLFNNTTGSNNVAVGNNNLVSTTTGSKNIAIGADTLSGNITFSENIAIGYSALSTHTASTGSIAVGTESLKNNTVGVNTAIGNYSLTTLTSGTSNTVIGENALRSATAVSNNTAIGADVLRSATTANGNVAVGVSSQYSNLTGSGNVAIGNSSLYYNTASNYNTAIGDSALIFCTGGDNTAIGKSAAISCTTGTKNTGVGVSSLNNITSGAANTAVGWNAMKNITTGSGNLCLGTVNSSGTYSTVFDVTTENNRVVVGSTSVTNAYVQVAWTVVSDARDKTNITSVPHGLDFVKKLQPISYQFRVARDSEEVNGGVRYGFKAQDVLALEGDNPVIVDNEDPDKLRLVDTAMIPILVNALKELNDKFEAYVKTHP